MTFEYVRKVLVSRDSQTKLDFLYNYCLSKGKDPQLSKFFVENLWYSGEFNDYFDYALRQSMIEFKVQYLLSKEGNILIINQYK